MHVEAATHREVAVCGGAGSEGAPLRCGSGYEQVVEVSARGGQDVPERGEQHPRRHDHQPELHRESVGRRSSASLFHKSGVLMAAGGRTVTVLGSIVT